MCYDYQARPPYPPIAGGVATGEDLVLTAADGNKFMAYAARSGNANGAGIIIYPDVRGLHPFYKELALRFAEVGVSAVALDYFGRTAGLTARDDAFEFRPHVQQMTLPTFFADVNAALAHLRTLIGNRSAFTVGFCMGGNLILYTSLEGMGLAGGIAFYAGMGRAWDETRGKFPEAGKNAKIPVLGLFGGADPGIPNEQVHELDKALDQSGVAHNIRIYDGAPHSFFDRRFADYQTECDDAWTRMLEFIQTQAK
jgi:carboxymethylenebutenolidase